MGRTPWSYKKQQPLSVAKGNETGPVRKSLGRSDIRHSYQNASTPQAELGSNFYRRKPSCLIKKIPVLSVGLMSSTGTFESTAPHAQVTYVKIRHHQLPAL